ncbi:MAG: hypothetical protein ACYTG4_02060 [Planctomycetota bacterium]|jgi:hypothetical protein
MFPFPPTPPIGPDAKGGVTPAERGKIIVLAVAFLVVLAFGAFLVLSESALLGGADESGASSVAPDAPDVNSGGGPPTVDSKEPRIVPLFPEDEADMVRQTIRDGLEKLPAIVDGASAEDPEPFEFLVGQVAGNFRVINLKGKVFEVLKGTADIREDPGAHRGRLIRVTGRLLSIERLPYEGKHKIVKELRRGVVRAADGTLYTFTEPVGSAFGATAEVPADGWVRLHGLFYKTWRVDKAPDGGDGGMSLHLVLKSPPVRDYEPREVKTIEAEWMSWVKDKTPAEMNQWDRDPLYLLMNMARTLGPEGFDAWLKARQAEFPDQKFDPPEDFANRSRELLDAPDLHRFRPVTYTGFLARPSRLPLQKPNAGHIEDVYLGFLVTDDYIPVWVFSHRGFTEQGFQDEDRLRMRGFFYMRTSFKPRGGGEMLMAPVFVAVDFEKLPPRQIEGIGMDLMITIIALMTGLLGLLGFAFWQGRKETAAAEERRLKQVERRRKARREGSPDGEDDSGTGEAKPAP